MGGDCLAIVSVSLFVDRESEERVQRSRVGGNGLEESQSLCLLTEKARRESRGAEWEATVSQESLVSLFVDRESEESPEEPSGRRLSRNSLSLFVC